MRAFYQHGLAKESCGAASTLAVCAMLLPSSSQPNERSECQPGSISERRRRPPRPESLRKWIESTSIPARSQKELLRINGMTAGGKNLRTGFVHTSCPSLIIPLVLPAGNAPESFEKRGRIGASVPWPTKPWGRRGSVQGFPSGHYGPGVLEEHTGPESRKVLRAQRNGRGQKSPAGRGSRATYLVSEGSAKCPASRPPLRPHPEP
jgi:hypothetical protein